MIQVRGLTEADLPFGMRLKAQAGWNQTDDDWRRAYLLQPDGCFVAELDGTAVGTLTTCIFGPVAWIALVLVDAAVRGRGVGTALMRHALVYLEQKQVRSVRLDATPLGRPVYEKLGFAAQFPLARYEGILQDSEAWNVETETPTDWADILRLDAAVTHTDRNKLLKHLFIERPDALRIHQSEGQLEGYITFRSGANATQIGPCLATTPEAGRALLAFAQHACTGQRVYVDVPKDNTPAVRCVTDLGLTEQRPLLRMCRGEPVCEQIEQLWASSGPEKG
jgi:ribosomal protein S18 acetylase RimI-like enzyme